VSKRKPAFILITCYSLVPTPSMVRLENHRSAFFTPRPKLDPRGRVHGRVGNTRRTGIGGSGVGRSETLRLL